MIRRALCALLLATTSGAAPLITEFIAENDRGLRDSDQQKRDWIEIFNPGPQVIALGDYFLTDNPLLPQKWRLPARTLGAGEYFTVFASGLNLAPPAGEAHTNFALENAGEYLALTGPAGVVHEYAPKYPPQVADVSYGVPVSAQTATLVSGATTASVLVPSNPGELPPDWHTNGFSTATATGPAAAGFDNASAAITNGMVLHASLDNADVGAGAGADTTQTAVFQVRDTAGTAENGQAKNVTTGGTTATAHVISGQPGIVGQALQLDPASAADSRAVDFGDVHNAGTGDYTVSVWFQTTSTTTLQFIAAKGNQSSGQAGWSLFIENGTIKARVGGGTTSNRASQTSPAFSTNEWHHVALVVNSSAGTVTGYLDGSNTGWTNGGGGPTSNTYPVGTSLSNTNPLRLGIRNDGNAGFLGLLDDFAIWTRALGPEEVAEIYTAGAAGNPVSNLSNYSPLIGTNLAAGMHNANASAFVHVPFNVAGNPATIQTLRLRMRWDDGFIAYLNGTEIASRRAPAAAQWNSAATAGPGLLQDEVLDLSPHIGLLQPGANTLAIHGLNASAEDGDFLILPELTATTFTTGAPGYFLTPTPGAQNPAQAISSVQHKVSFSPAGGVFIGSQLVSLTGAPPGAQIRYTLDGTEPSAASPQYMAPLLIGTSTEIRARIFLPGEPGGRIYHASFVKLAPDVQGFTSPLPIIVLDNLNRGDIPNYRAANPPAGDGGGLTQVNRQPAFMAIFENPGGTVSTASAPALSTRIGIRVRGSSSASTQPKKKQSYSIEAWGSLDEHSEGITPFGLPRDPDWVLYAPYNYDRALIRNALAYELMRRMGHYAPRTQFAQVFINTDGGDLSMADFAGVFVWMESIKRDDDRVNLHQFADDGLTGGWMVQSDRMDPLPEDGRTTPPWHFHTAGPNRIKQGPYGGSSGSDQGGDDIPTGYNTFMNFTEPSGYDSTAAQRSAIMAWFDSFEDVLYGPDFREPATGYAAWLDRESFINHFLLVNFTRNVDGLQLSTHMFRRHEGDRLHLNPPWDYDRSMDSYDSRDDNTTGAFGETFLWFPRLFSDPVFAQARVDRWQQLRRGPLSTANVNALIDSMAAEITAPVAAANFAKWNAANNTPRSGGWPAEIAALKTWLAARAAWLDSQFPAPPAYSLPGGEVAPGATVVITGGGTVYFTTDGTDPLDFTASGLVISGSAAVYAAPVAINSTTTLTARVFTGSQWSGPLAVTYTVGAAQPAAGNLVISEIHYHPAAPSAAENPGGFLSATDFEFVELMNIGASPLNLEGVRITGDIEFTFPTGVILAPGERILVVENLAAFRARYGDGPVVAGEYNGNLNNSGALIALITSGGADIVRFTWDDAAPWPPDADGAGFSLTLANPQSNPAPNHPANWRTSLNPGGSPGVSDASTWSGEPGTLFAYAFGANATVQLMSGGANAVLSFQRNVSADDVDFHIERSTEIPAWGIVTDGAYLGETRNPDGTATIRWQIPVPPGASRIFLRVVATATP